jgi:hypothetical protein
MAQLISMSVICKDSTVLSPSAIYGIPGDQIKFVTAATTNQKKAAPSASQGINTAVYVTDFDNASGTNHIYLVNESVSTIISGS